jgi:crossover junction endodeoxyribonuclease RusA
VNRIHGYGRGRVYRSSEYKAWIAEANVAWLQQRNRLPVKRIKGRYTLEVLVYPPDKRQRDVGNLEKVVSDFLQMIEVIENDYLSKWVKFEWADPPYTNDGIELTVRPYP